MPLVLTTNEVVLNPDHAWDDIEGVQYHYPNQYKNKIKTGERFIYYRGVHRMNGKRGPAEYFGRGVIGAIRDDLATMHQARPSWFCAIDDYQPFGSPIPAKRKDGQFYEQMPPNMWRNGVRELPDEIYSQIVLIAETDTALNPPTPPTVVATESDKLIVPRTKAIAGGKGAGTWRTSKQARLIGDWAEEAAIMFARTALSATNVEHRARNGEKPGWDFDYADEGGETHRVEVKGTVAGRFTSLDLTAGEYNAAKLHQQSYWIYLVANCLTDRPLIQRIQNPAQMIAEGRWNRRPILFNVTFGES